MSKKKVKRARRSKGERAIVSLGRQIEAELQPIEKLGATLRASDASSEAVRHMLELVIEEMAAAREDEGLIYGPLAVAARYASEQLAMRHGLDVNEELALKHWLIGQFGEQIHNFDVVEFGRWNAARADRVRQLAPEFGD